jgi:hypothetical protein
MKTSRAESAINRHFRWEAIFMAAMFVVPVVVALAAAFVGPVVYSWLR